MLSRVQTCLDDLKADPYQPYTRPSVVGRWSEAGTRTGAAQTIGSEVASPRPDGRDGANRGCSPLRIPAGLRDRPIGVTLRRRGQRAILTSCCGRVWHPADLPEGLPHSIRGRARRRTYRLGRGLPPGCCAVGLCQVDGMPHESQRATSSIGRMWRVTGQGMRAKTEGMKGS